MLITGLSLQIMSFTLLSGEWKIRKLLVINQVVNKPTMNHFILRTTWCIACLHCQPVVDMFTFILPTFSIATNYNLSQEYVE